MKLSEAVLLGSTNLRLEPKVWQSPVCACLIGMGLSAMGREPREDQAGTRNDAIAMLPWLADGFAIPSILAGNHLVGYFTRISVWGVNKPGQLSAWQIISALAYEVKDGIITLEQAIDWIRENEPQEPEVVQPEAKEAEESYVAQ